MCYFELIASMLKYVVYQLYEMIFLSFALKFVENNYTLILNNIKIGAQFALKEQLN